MPGAFFMIKSLDKSSVGIDYYTEKKKSFYRVELVANIKKVYDLFSIFG